MSDELKNEFLIESFENLSNISDQLGSLEKDPKNKELINAIYRTVHTMKGSANFLGYEKLSDLTHNAENLLDLVREDIVPVNASLIDILFGVFDLCTDISKSIETKDNEGDRDTKTLSNKLAKFVEAKSVHKEEASVQQTQADEIENLIADHQNELGSSNTQEQAEQSKSVLPEDDLPVNLAAIAQLKEQVDEGMLDASILDDFQEELKQLEALQGGGGSNQESHSPAIEETVIEEDHSEEELLAEVEKSKPIDSIEDILSQEKEALTQFDDSPSSKDALGNTLSIADSFVRVNVATLDKIMNIVGELVLNRNQIVQHSNTSRDGEFHKLSQQLNIITSELQSEVMATRMQPVGNILTKFEKLVRNISRENDKKIRLVLTGTETELDKTLLEAIKDPIVHILRNACDHGIESTSERKSSSKNEEGTINIKAYNESGQVTIEINDDGKGLNPEPILKKAIEKGIISKEKSNAMNEQEIFALIFEPGFSTAEKVTSISGRGVGMDVVRTNVEKIGGSVVVNSVLGEGTTFKLRIPLTLAIVPALIINTNNEFFAIPQLNLVELVRVEEDQADLIENIKGTEFLKLRGNLTPIFRINDLLDLEKVKQNRVSQSSEFENMGSKLFEDKGLNIVVMQAEGRIFGIVVDQIMDTEEIVVKPLSNHFNKIGIYGGATIMGDGRVALIIDAMGFLTRFTGVKDKKAQENLVDEDHDSIALDRQENLLFKLGDEQTYAVPLSLVSRLEEFSTSAIEKTGTQPIIRYLDKPMPLINIEQVLKLTAATHSEDSDKVSCIVTSIRDKNYGIVVKEIMDINFNDVDIDSTAVDRKGIMGTIFVGDKIVSMVDLFEVISSQNLGQQLSPTLSKTRGQSILLVEDSTMYGKLAMDALKAEGYDVTWVKNGQAGVETIQSGKFDLVITDIEMPILDGFGFASTVRGIEGFVDIPIVALSTRVSDEDKRKGRMCGFNYHLEKFKREEVVDLVNNILS